MVRRFYHSQQYTLNKGKNQVSGTSVLRYICLYLSQIYLSQQPKIWKSAESNIDSDKNARHFTRQRKIKKQWNTHPLLPLESPYLFPFFSGQHTLRSVSLKKSKIFGWRVLRRQYALPKPTKIVDIPISHHLVCLMVSLVNGFMFSQVNTQPMICYPSPVCGFSQRRTRLKWKGPWHSWPCVTLTSG